MLEAIKELALEPLPDLPTCDSKTFGQVLRMMLAVLPRRQADDMSGELFVAAYERQLGYISKPQAEYMMDKALATCRWFPTIAECIEILQGWHRSDGETAKRSELAALVVKENNARNKDQWEWRARKAEPITQEMVDCMSEQLLGIGLKCGALAKDKDGTIRPIDDVDFSGAEPVF